MGHRAVKRVDPNWKWPEHMVWGGYLNPYEGSLKCKPCDGRGLAPEAKRLSDAFYDHDSYDHRNRWCDKLTQEEVDHLVAEGRFCQFTHTWSKEDGWQPKPGVHLSAEVVNANTTMHDGISAWIALKFRAKSLGLQLECDWCNGEGSIPYPDPEIVKLHDAWQDFDPPAGDGWQMWETVSEGSPISPIFATAEELADHCAEHVGVFGREKTTRENWLRMIREDTVEEGSMFISVINPGEPAYIGAAVNAPEESTAGALMRAAGTTEGTDAATEVTEGVDS